MVVRPDHRKSDRERDAGQEQAIHDDGRNRRPGGDQHPARHPEEREAREPPAGESAEAGPRPRRRQQEARHHRRSEA